MRYSAVREMAKVGGEYRGHDTRERIVHGKHLWNDFIMLIWNGCCYLVGHHRLLLGIFYSSHTFNPPSCYLMADACVCVFTRACAHKHTLRYTKSKSILNVFGIPALYFIDVACFACCVCVCVCPRAHI